MSVCPGCGRCRECGHPAPIVVQPWPWQPQPHPQPIWINPQPPTWFSPTAAPTVTWTVGANTGSAL